MSTQPKILDIVLFFSKYSKECKSSVDFIMSNKLPFKLIALDTEESRELAANGSPIQIVNVPSLTVSYEDGNVQLFVGNVKIISWIKEVLSTRPQPRKQVNFQNPNTNHQSQSIKPKLKKDKKKKKKIEIEYLEETSLDDGIPNDENYQSSEYPDSRSFLKPVYNTLSTVKEIKPSNSSIMEQARKMRADRESTLGYKAE